MSGAAPGRSGDAEANKGRVETTKVKRYRPGQVPEWMREEDQDLDIPLSKTHLSNKGEVFDELEAAARSTEIAPPVIVKRADDPRLARLAQTQAIDRSAAPLRHRHAEDTDVGDGGEPSSGVVAPQIVRRARHRSPEEEGEEEEGAAAVKGAVKGDGAVRRPQRELDGSSGGAGAGADISRHPLRQVDEDQQNDASNSEEAIAARRAAMRKRLQQEEEENAAALAAQKISQKQEGSEEEEEESGSSEYETDDSDDSDEGPGGGALGHRPLAKPVFVPRVSRETLAEREALEREEEEAADKERLRLEARKEETREIVAARMAEEAAQEAAAAAGPVGAEDVLTDDDAVDAEEEYESWRLRELKRVARDREEREKEAREVEERERWKGLTEEQRAAELAARPKEERAPKEKKAWGFLQKYYHKGAFFQTEAEYKGEEKPLAGEATIKDFSAPTGADRMDKSTLPAIMQVKDFGRRGRSKWTHLVDEDTTDFAAPWNQDEKVNRKMEGRRAGTEQVFTKPKNTKT